MFNTLSFKLFIITLITLTGNIGFLNNAPMFSPQDLHQIILKADNSDEIKVNTSLEDDLKSFGYDVENKYYFNSEQTNDASIINYLISTDEQYLDIFYVFNPLDRKDILNCHIKVYGDDSSLLEKDIELILIDKFNNFYRYYSKDLAFDDEYINFKKDNINLYYEINIIDGNLSSQTAYFEFSKIDDKSRNTKKSNSQPLNQRYNTTIEVELIDPHCWSYRFDPDSPLINIFEELFLKSDTLNDQLFYTFDLKGWEKYQIKQINLQYKKLLLHGQSATIISNMDVYNYFDENYNDLGDIQISPTYVHENKDPRARYYIWDESNSENNYQENDELFLGYTKEEVKDSSKYQKLPWTKKEITSENVSENIGSTTYNWKTIQTAKEFKDAFKGNEAILSFANKYLKNDDYYIINFDDFYYSYDTRINAYFTFDYALEHGGKTWKNFLEYCKNNSASVSGVSGATGINYPAYLTYNFYQELVFDISAESMILTNSQNQNIYANTNVKKVDEENSGGDSETPIEDILDNMIESLLSFYGNAKNIFFIVLAIIGGLVILYISFKIFNSYKNNNSQK